MDYDIFHTKSKYIFRFCIEKIKCFFNCKIKKINFASFNN